MNKKLSGLAFSLSMLLILIVGLAFLGGLYYFLNIKDQRPASSLSSSGNPLTAAPTTLILDLSEPDDGMLVFDKTLTISGTTLPNLSVLISSDSGDNVVVAKPNGSFSTDFPLTLGINNITITAFDKTGNQKQLTRTIYYNKDQI
jgi:hypothetical protein